MTFRIKEGTEGTLLVGAYVDGSGIAAGSLNIIMADIFISKNGGALATIGACATAYADRLGYYMMPYGTFETDTRGFAKIVANKSGYLPVWHDLEIVPTVKWDFLYGDGVIPTVGIVGTVNFAKIVGSAGHVASMSNPAVPFVGSIGYAGLVGTVDYSRVVGSAFHVASMSNPYVGGGIIGSVGHVASMANPNVPFVGSVGFAQIVGTVTYVGLVGSVGHVASMSNPIVGGGVIGSVNRVQFVEGGVLGSVGHVGSLANITDIGDTLLKRDIDQVEAAAAKHSLTTAILKAVAKVKDNAGTLEIYRTDGATLHASQAITTDANNLPIDELGGAT